MKIFARKQFCCLKDADGTNCKLDCGLNVDEKDDDKELEMTGCGVYWCDLWSETKVDRSSLMVELQYMYLTSLKESVCDIIRECRCHTLDIAFDARSRNIYSDIKLLNRLSELVSLRISSWGVPVRAQKVVLRGTKLRSLVIRHSSSFISCDFSHLFGLESLKLAHCTYEEPVVYPENLKALKLAHSVVRINVNSIPSSLSKLSLSNISNASPIVVDFNSASELKEFTASTCVSLVIQRLPSSLTVLALSSIKCLVIKNDYFLSDCHQIDPAEHFR